MDEELLVDRCACINIRFSDLKQHGSFEAAQQASACGLECEGCVPYLRLMFSSGETIFDIDDPRLIHP